MKDIKYSNFQKLVFQCQILEGLVWFCFDPSVLSIAEICFRYEGEMIPLLHLPVKMLFNELRKHWQAWKEKDHECFDVMLHCWFFVCRKDQSSVLMQLPRYATSVYGSKLRMFLMMPTHPTMILLFLSLGMVLEITLAMKLFTLYLLCDHQYFFFR